MSIKKYTLLFLFFFTSLLHLKAQEFFIYGTNYDLFSIETWGHYDMGNCTVEMTNGNQNGVGDFSFTSLSTDFLYTFTQPIGATIDTTLNIQWINEIQGFIIPSNVRQRQFTDDHFVRAVICDYSGHLYAAGTGLSFYDATEDAMHGPLDLPDEDFSTYLGDLPPEMQAAGAMTYRQGHLFLTTISNTLVEVDIENPMASTVVATFPDEIGIIDAMVTFPYRCDSIVTYAIAREDSSSIIYVLGFEDYSLTEVCQVDLPIFGAAAAECIIPPCELFVDLDIDDSGGLTELDFSKDTICSAFYGLGDIDIEVFSAIKLDSLVIEVVFPPDGMEERLWLQGNAAISVMGSGTSTLTLVDNGNATDADFAALLQEVYYHNAAVMPTIGAREIIIIPHAWQYVGMPSKLYFVLDPAILKATETMVEPLCFGDDNGSITLIPQGSLSPYAVTWQDGQTDFLATNLSSGTNIYILTDSVGCTQEHSVFLNEPDSLVTTIEAAFDTICINSSTTLQATPMGGIPPYQYLWSTQGEQNQTLADEEGPHTLLVTDDHGCTDTASIQLTVIDTIFVTQENFVCEGEIFEWQNMTFTSDTLVCIGFNSFLGCDSIHCIDIQFLDTILVQESVSLCEGDFFETGGQNYFSDTTFCQILAGVNGCDSTYCLNLQFTERDTHLSATICEGDTYLFGGEVLSTAGIYVDSLAGVNGCDSFVVLQLSHWPIPEIEFQTDGNFCIDEEVSVSVEGFTTYQWSTGEQTSSAVFNQAGIYSLTGIDSNGCQITDTILLDDTALEVFYSSAPPLCYDGNEGFIQIDSVRNAILPVEILLDGVAQEQKNLFETLGLGTYQIEVIDADGCQSEIDIELSGPQELQLDLGEDQSIVFGDSILLPVDINFQAYNLQWTPVLSMACDTCLNTYFWPAYSTFYELTAVDSEDCQIKDGIWLFVNKQIGVYIPNAFSPNDDGINDFFTVFAHPSVSVLKSVQIFNRWGALVYTQKDIPPGIESYGWNGKVGGEFSPTGVYICKVEVEYLDGRNEILTEEVLLMR